MRTQTPAADGHSTVITYDNHLMTESAASPLRRVIEAPFTKRAWTFHLRSVGESTCNVERLTIRASVGTAISQAGEVDDGLGGARHTLRG